MNQVGHFALCVAWILTIYGMVAGGIGALKNQTKWVVSAANGTVAGAACALVAIVSLGSSFLSDDYSIQYVWQFSNAAMSGIYKIAAIWGGMDGSMLLWAFILSVNAAIVAFRTCDLGTKLRGWTLAILNSSCFFFFTITVFLTNPFRHIAANFIPADGNGLNPLLQNPLMAIHPPMLYLGFTTFAVPYAFCVAALISKDLSTHWITLTRRWTLVSWGFLTTGIVLGGHWAYVELGWGGFWAWDPVENASFLPWLTATAFLHSVMVQERKGMLKLWNVWLVVLTYCLTVFGTFLTRSGVVQSVHSFAETDVGWVFLVYLALVLVGTAIVTALRRVELAPDRKLESMVSRETAFLVNNLLLLTICFATLFGVMFPVLTEAFGEKHTVSIPFFNAVNVPLFLGLIVLMGIGPLLAWRKTTMANFVKTFMFPAVLSLLTTAVLIWAGIAHFYPLLSYAACMFVLLTILGEIHRGVKVQRAISDQGVVVNTVQLFQRHGQRYAGYLVHFGVLVATVSITASMAHKTEEEFSMAVGETHATGRFQLTLKDLGERQYPNFRALHAVTELSAGGKVIATLEPELRSYIRGQETTTEVALKTGLKDDFYLVLAGLDESGTRATFKAFVNPLQVWLWVGTGIMVLGTLILIFSTRTRVREPLPALEAQTAKLS